MLRPSGSMNWRAVRYTAFAMISYRPIPWRRGSIRVQRSSTATRPTSLSTLFSISGGATAWTNALPATDDPVASVARRNPTGAEALLRSFARYRRRYRKARPLPFDLDFGRGSAFRRECSGVSALVRSRGRAARGGSGHRRPRKASLALRRTLRSLARLRRPLGTGTPGLAAHHAQERLRPARLQATLAVAKGGRKRVGRPPD